MKIQLKSIKNYLKAKKMVNFFSFKQEKRRDYDLFSVQI